MENWKIQGNLKNIEIETLQSIMWSIISAIIIYCKNNQMKPVDDIYLDAILDAVKK